MPRESSGSPNVPASPVVSSPRFINAIACTLFKWFRTLHRSRISTRA